jgi:Flp pilus assembly protein TadG
MRRRPTAFLRRLGANRRGSIVAEAAVAIAVLVSMSLSGLEFARYTLLNQKMERVSAEIADLVSRDEAITDTDIANIFAAVDEIASPFDVQANGKVIVSAVGITNNGPLTMYWQRSSGSYTATSHIGTPGNGVTLPAGFTVASGTTAIIAEVTYHYTPWVLPGLIGNPEVYDIAFYRPRFGTLNQVN